MKKIAGKLDSTHETENVVEVSQKTDRVERFWLKGKPKDLPVHRIPIRYLYFNIENGRYADKMIQLRADNPGDDIDPRVEKWKVKIWEMLKGEYPGTTPDSAPFAK